MRSSKLLRCVLSAACVLLVASVSLKAETYTLTTRASDGGFDGWIDRYGAKSSTDVRLQAGNLDPRGYDRSSAVFMFDLSALPSFEGQQIVSVELTYYVIQAFTSPVLTVTHGVKTTKELLASDSPSTLLNTVWDTSLGNVSPGPSGTGVVSLDVTAAFLADLAADNAYSSFRLAQPNVYPNGASYPMGSYIASSENTSGYLVPSLIITTQQIPEPAHLGALLAGSVTLLAVFLYRRRRG